MPVKPAFSFVPPVHSSASTSKNEEKSRNYDALGTEKVVESGQLNEVSSTASQHGEVM
jgi:hypothetical protein